MRTLFYVLLSGLFRSVKRRYRHVMDRSYSACLAKKLAKCGQGVHVYHPFQISGAHRAEFGNNIHINRGAFIRASGGLIIGDNVHVGRNLTLYTINHQYEGVVLPYDDTVVEKPVVIGKNVWIGANATIVPGVTIGEGAIIAAGTTVSRDVPALAVVGSAPQRTLKFRDETHYWELEQQGRYGGVNGRPCGGSD